LSNYCPSGPYIFKGGKRKGVVLESLMFKDYNFLLYLLAKIRKEKGDSENKNELEKHLEWLLARGENRETKALCPQCGKKRVVYLSVAYSRFDFSAGPYYTSCENRECIERLRGMATKSIALYPFRFSTLKNFRSKTDQKRIGNIFKWAFGLPSPLRRERLFAFFSE